MAKLCKIICIKEKRFSPPLAIWQKKNCTIYFLLQELKVISDLLTAKYGKIYADACRNENVNTISEKLKHKMSVQSPPKILVEKYLIEIAKNYNVEYTPDEQVMREEEGM